MEKMRPVYRKISDWAILDERVIHDFSENENAITIIEVLIGTLHYMNLDFHYHLSEHRTPIIRWMTRKQYEYLLQQEGTIIW